MTDSSHNRRDFLKGVTLSSVGLAALSAEEIVLAQARPAATPAAARPEPVMCAVIGLGPRGREILQALARMPGATVGAVSDTYTVPAFVRRARDIVPRAAFMEDYRRAIAMPIVRAVFVATPTHLHKQIVLDALQAGKHVYCEAPLAVDLAEARAIAQAGAAARTVFQPGLQYRTNMQHTHVYTFMRAGALGRHVGGRGQWHRKGSWKRPGPTPDRERAINWRLRRATSLGLPGEVGIHGMDVAAWYLRALPVAVQGFGATIQWTADGMEVPDTVQCVLEFPRNVRFIYSATLANSFEDSYEVLYGSDCAILIKDQRAWMFKETDAPLLGWEVWARKDRIGDETGIALIAGSTQLLAQGRSPSKEGFDVSKTALFQACESFLNSVRTNSRPLVGALEGLRANVIAAKAHEAVTTGQRIAFQREWFELS